MHNAGEFDAYYEGEPRYWTMGAPNSSVILFVVYTIRPVFEGHIVTRIISARPVTKAERRRYEQRAKHR